MRMHQLIKPTLPLSQYSTESVAHE